MATSVFEDDDFKSLRYNLSHVESDVLNSRQGRGLSKIESFSSCKRPDKDKLIKYIVFLYSKESPLVRNYKDVGVRMREAAKLAGYDLGIDATLLDKLYRFEIGMTEAPEDWDYEEDGYFNSEELPEDLEFVTMVIDYLRHQNDLVWAMIVSNEQTFYEYQEALVQSVNLFKNDKDKLSAIQVKTKLMEDSDAIAERLEKYYKKVFTEDEIVKRVKQVYTPEMMAKKK